MPKEKKRAREGATQQGSSEPCEIWDFSARKKGRRTEAQGSALEEQPHGGREEKKSEIRKCGKEVRRRPG